VTPRKWDFTTALGSGWIHAALVHARLTPQIARHAERVDTGGLPPTLFVANAVNRAVVHAAEWDSEFIAGLAPECARLRVSQVVGIGRRAAADQASLLGDVA
jgi:hypothetical protein